jgi:VanZ family protein
MGLELTLFLGASAAVLAGCLVPNRWLPRLPNDKFLHFASFILLSVLALSVAGSGAERWLWLLGLLIGGWVIECLQILVPGRSFCWGDVAANASGIAVVAVGAQLVDCYGRATII